MTNVRPRGAISSADRRIERVLFLELIDPGTAETDESPGIDDSGKAVLLPGETVLFESKTFPSMRTVDAASGKARDTHVPGDGGITQITDRRVIFVREKYDVGAFGKRFVNPVLRAASRTIASVRRGDTVAAGHFRYSNVDSLSYKRERKLDAAVGVVRVLDHRFVRYLPSRGPGTQSAGRAPRPSGGSRQCRPPRRAARTGRPARWLGDLGVPARSPLEPRGSMP